MTLNEIIGNNKLYWGKPLTTLSLGVIPILSDAETPIIPAFLLVEQAIASGAFKVTEISEAGHVPTLRGENNGPNPVLVTEGTLLRGGKQDRLVVASIIVDAGKTAEISVNCSESKRFEYQGRPDFQPAKDLFRAQSRARSKLAVSKTLVARKSFRGDQIETWNEISDSLEGLADLGVRSATSSYCKGIESLAPTIDSFLEHISPVEKQVGALFVARDRVLGAELFTSSSLFRSAFASVIGSFAVEVIRDPVINDLNINGAGAWWEEVLKSPCSIYASIGGDHVQVTTDTVVGSGLQWKKCSLRDSWLGYSSGPV